MTQKHARLAVKAVEALGAIVTIEHGRGHYRMNVTSSGQTVTVPVSSSPRDERACVNMACQMVKRRMLEKGVQL